MSFLITFQIRTQPKLAAASDILDISNDPARALLHNLLERRAYSKLPLRDLARSLASVLRGSLP
jgi:hypothetical protein